MLGGGPGLVKAGRRAVMAPIEAPVGKHWRPHQAHSEDVAKRFVPLIDEFYDRHVKLVLSAAAASTELYDSKRLRAGFGRTESRLVEMRRVEYLALPHLPE